MIANRVIGGNGGETASIFVTGLSEGDTVIATKDGKTYVGKWSNRPNPSLHGLPSGYTELEYIESTGTQYIDFGFPIKTTTFKIQIGALFTATSSNEQPLISTWVSNYNYWNLFLNSSNKLNMYYNGHMEASSISVGAMYDIELGTDATGVYGYSGKRWVSVNGTVTSTSTSLSNTNTTTLKLFSRGDLNGKTSGRISYLRYYEGTSLVVDCIPAKRNSDGAIGLYDIVSNTFFSNSGTGSFVAGDEIPSTVNGHLIDGLREYGTYTVTATNGTDTTTQDVLVDMATQYDIEMSFFKGLKLYWYGDECEDVTGGWSQKTGWKFGNFNSSTTFSNSSYQLSKQDNYLTLPSYYIYSSNATTNNQVDLTTYSKMHVLLENRENDSTTTIIGWYVINNSIGSVSEALKLEAGTTINNVVGIDSELEIDISNITGVQYIAIIAYSDRSFYIKKVWLE